MSLSATMFESRTVPLFSDQPPMTFRSTDMADAIDEHLLSRSMDGPRRVELEIEWPSVGRKWRRCCYLRHALKGRDYSTAQLGATGGGGDVRGTLSGAKWTADK